MSAEHPCSEMVIEVRRFQLRWTYGVELISAPGGYERIISSCRHRISLQELCLAYRNTQTELSSTCQMVFRTCYGSKEYMPKEVPAMLQIYLNGVTN
jgi:hypothetical protein